jgi:hypothetical protein
LTQLETAALNRTGAGTTTKNHSWDNTFNHDSASLSSVAARFFPVASMCLPGKSEPVFAISALLGIKLMARIRNWKYLTFVRPSADANYKHINLLFN